MKIKRSITVTPAAGGTDKVGYIVKSATNTTSYDPGHVIRNSEVENLIRTGWTIKVVG